ncbi:MAG: Holliday junction resolvase Hjc [Candidatus Micrarchaeaceae archaeon]
MHRYMKGARSERELLNTFYNKGYSVLRSAGSGVNSLGPDIIAIKDKICIAIECKAWEKNRLSIDLDGYKKLYEWEQNTKFPTYIAWRMNGKGWFFIKLEELKKGEKDYSITKIKALELNRLLDSILPFKQEQNQETYKNDILNSERVLVVD